MSARKVYIVKKGNSITSGVILEAQLLECTEVACGIPPRLHGVVTDDKLPCVYEEPAPEPPLEDPIIKAIKAIEERLLILENRCFVQETGKEPIKDVLAE